MKIHCLFVIFLSFSYLFLILRQEHLLVSQMSYAVRAVETVERHLCSLWCAISTHIWAFSRKSAIKLQSIIINTADPTGSQGEKMSLWGTNCFLGSFVITFLEHMISFSNLSIGTHQFAILVCWKRIHPCSDLDQTNFYKWTSIFIQSR